MTLSGADPWRDMFQRLTFGYYEPVNFIHAGEFGLVYEARRSNRTRCGGQGS
jgi:hypothetical protein